MGEDSSQKNAEIAALPLSLDIGMRLIDTAEMYDEGSAEEFVGEIGNRISGWASKYKVNNNTP